MDDEHAFFEAIRAAPTDPLPRLVYADWLEERGDADRATFLRLRVESAQLPSDDPAAVRLRRRERTLVEVTLARWLHIPDAPVWCLLGGGLADPVPHHIAQLNVESWRRMAGFYDEFTNQPAGRYTVMSRLVNELAGTEAVKLFMAGSSLATFIVSTADEYGAVPEVPFITVEMTRDARFVLHYYRGMKAAATASAGQGQVRGHLIDLLARLWADTRGQWP